MHASLDAASPTLTRLTALCIVEILVGGCINSELTASYYTCTLHNTFTRTFWGVFQALLYPYLIKCLTRLLIHRSRSICCSFHIPSWCQSVCKHIEYRTMEYLAMVSPSTEITHIKLTMTCSLCYASRFEFLAEAKKDERLGLYHASYIVCLLLVLCCTAPIDWVLINSESFLPKGLCTTIPTSKGWGRSTVIASSSRLWTIVYVQREPSSFHNHHFCQKGHGGPETTKVQPCSLTF